MSEKTLVEREDTCPICLSIPPYGGCASDESCAYIVKLQRELAQAQARCAEVERDAARYMWLWQQTVDTFHGNVRAIYIVGLWPSPDGIDSAIDAAIKENK